MEPALSADRETLLHTFSTRGIPVEELAFYNHPAFLAAETADPAFIEFYGAWVRARPRDEIYDTHVRRIVPCMAELLAAELARDGQSGVCIDVSMMFTKMLEEEGVWCYAAKGALTIDSPELDGPTHLCMFDDNGNSAAGHVWVVAPPFEIIDVTLKQQLWQSGEANLLPTTVVLETAAQIVPTAEDFLSSGMLLSAFAQHGALPTDYHLYAAPSLRRPA